MVRGPRLRWTNAYWTPVEAGLFVGAPDQVSNVILAHVQTEGGVRLPLSGGEALELGLAAGFGILAIPYAVDCDGTCDVGGVGILVSPVARYLFHTDSHWSVGAVLRGVVPLLAPHDRVFGYITGRGAILLGGVDVAFGG